MMNAERREKVRVHPKDLTFVALRPDFDKLGKMLDISKGGLCFQYITSTGEADQVNGVTSLDIDLFLSKNSYYLAGVPCKLIYDKKKEIGALDPTNLEYRLCGLKFGELTKGQTNLLEFYLSYHTANAV
ncbi:PilZ domain-containing protein [Thermodesulfobacteriota bacterium]